MKKTLLPLLFACFVANFSQAQITYTSASFQQAGDVVVLTTATDSTLTVTPASAVAQAWDFSTLVAINTNVDTVQAASTGADFASFPNTDILQPLVQGLGGLAYVDVTSTDMTRIGGGLSFFGISFVSGYQNQHIIQVAPMTYPHTASDDYELNFSAHIDSIPFLRALLDSIAGSVSQNADSIRINLDGREVREIEAFGTCMLSDSTYDVLRQKVLNIITLKIEVYASFFGSGFWLDVSNTIGGSLPVALPDNDSTIYYDYLAEGVKQPLVRLQLDPTLTFVANIQYLQGDTTTIGIKYIADELDVNIFPNPANQYINIQTDEMPVDGYQLHVVDMTGRIVLQKNAIHQNAYQLPVEALPNGHYVVVLRDTKGVILKRQQVDILK